MSRDIEEIVDFFHYANAYFKLCKILISEKEIGKSVTELSDLEARVFRVGPVYQNLGLTTELTFKTALLLAGCDKTELKRLGHDLIKLYDRLDLDYDLTNVENVAFQAAVLVGLPAGMLSRIENSGQPTSRWFNLQTHIKSLNSNYSLFENTNGEYDSDRFRSRYPAKDRAYRDVCIEAVMAGVDTLLSELQVELNARLSNKGG
ncbi:hypothetical protein [Ruegeria atlantica]|uniref:hypothetical protein n=1 Tax=Ruegeria atlantica TaxID=81569 RepID=UPI0014819290|nr:hypothetical protein [Ruegeria atlantica]